MYCYSNNGYSMRAVDDNYTAQAGEVLFTDLATTPQLQAAFLDYASGPILSKEQKFAEINNTYSTKLNGILVAISQAQARGSANTVTTLQTTYNSTQVAWKAALQAVINPAS